MAKALEDELGQGAATALIKEIDRLCRHIEALQKSAQLLAMRLTPYEDEDKSKVTAPPWTMNVQMALWSERKKPVTLETLRVIVKQADYQLEGAESDFRIIKSKVEAIANDAYLTADWKEWMDRGKDGKA